MQYIHDLCKKWKANNVLTMVVVVVAVVVFVVATSVLVSTVADAIRLF